MPTPAELLAVARTDRTFTEAQLPGRGQEPARPAWKGRCFYCETPIWLLRDGSPVTDVSLEHILPRAHGGDDSPRNLALACSRCNQQKGRRVDARPRSDARAREVITAAQARRSERWRDG
jgi:5-methylcytosine-specific restriction endonuclease McrA